MILEYATDSRRVWGTYDDGATITPRAGAALMAFTGDLSGLGCGLDQHQKAMTAARARAEA
ncbi:hypothetical protein [Methylobacterium sp. 1973]|uniref:hypothetical protein n=1 Tax=Methylobacterium sp. 1973 TaxID=3156421 RepID=UPI00339B91F4